MAIDAKVRHCCRYVTSSRGNVRWRSLCRHRSQWELIHQAVVYRPLVLAVPLSLSIGRLNARDSGRTSSPLWSDLDPMGAG